MREGLLHRGAGSGSCVARRRGVQFLRVCLLSLLALTCARSQTPGWGMFDVSRGVLTGGVQVTKASAYVGAYDLSGATASLPGGGSSMIEAGAATELGWFFPGSRVQSFVRYDVEYDANQRYPVLDGTSNFLNLGIRMRVTPRTYMTIFASGDRSIQSAFLFRPTTSLAATSSATSAEDLGGALSDSTSAIPVGSPLNLLLLGGKRLEFAAGVDLTFLQSPRMTWTVTEHGITERPVTLQEPGVTETSSFPAVTDYETSAKFSYSLSRRTQIGFGAGLLQSYSTFGRIQVASQGVNIDHLLSRQFFVSGRADFEMLSVSRSGLPTPTTNSYGLGSSIGYKGSNNSFSLSARRDVGDMYGFGASTTTAADIAWEFSRANRAWTLQNALTSQRLTGGAVKPIQFWLYQTTFSRRLSSRLSFVMQGVYASTSIPSGFALATVPQRGVRLSLAWTPAAVALP